jgi:hypothetical protein
VATGATTGRGRRLLELLGGQHGVQTGCNLGITRPHLLLHKIVVCHGLRQGKQMLLAPMAFEGFGNRLRIVLTASIAMPREHLRIVFAGYDGPNDPHARFPRDVTDDLGQLHIH